jgi:putative transposase
MDRLWKGYRHCLYIVQPRTVCSYWRDLWRYFWRRKSKRGRPQIPFEIIHMIRRFARENPLWEAADIQGQIRLLTGQEFDVGTIAKYVPNIRNPRGGGPGWQEWLKAHRDHIAAVDMFVTYTWNFVPVYVLFVISHCRREIRHFNVTRFPTAGWVRQQMREAFDGGRDIRFLIHDSEPSFKACRDFLGKILRIAAKRTAVASPWQNGIAERWVGTARRGLTNWIIPKDERHLYRLMKEYVTYYNEDRTHTTLYLDTPAGKVVQLKPSPNSKLRRIPRVRGLYNVYEWENAA